MTSHIKAIGFDWDGTLADSMQVKAEAFAKTLVKRYPVLNEEEIIRIYWETRGTPRVEQVAEIQRRYGLQQLTPEEDRAWSEEFTATYSQKPIPLFEDTSRVLEPLGKGLHLFVTSGMSQTNLDRTIRQYTEVLNRIRFALGYNGTFRKGLPHLSYAAKELQVPINTIAVVGDGTEDIRGGKEAGCMTIAKVTPDTRKELQAVGPDLMIERLEELLNYFPIHQI